MLVPDTMMHVGGLCCARIMGVVYGPAQVVQGSWGRSDHARSQMGTASGGQERAGMAGGAERGPEHTNSHQRAHPG